MKKIAHKFIISTLFIFTITFGTLFLGTELVKAQLADFVPQVEIPGLGSSMSVGEVTGKNQDMVSSTLLRDYIIGIYNYSFAIAGILAAIVLMGGGVLWLISGGSPDKISKAKKIIGSSLIGLVLLFGSRLILNTINPELIKMKALEFPGIEPDTSRSDLYGCCLCAGSHVAQTGTIGGTLYIPGQCEDGVGYSEEDCEIFCKPSRYTFVPHNVCKQKVNKSECVPYKEEGDVVLIDGVHENGFNTNGWTFQDGIKNQVGDMSSELVSFMNCMRENLDKDGHSDVNQINSISDNNVRGNLGFCNKEECLTPNPCQHSCLSCHYGGGKKDERTEKLINKSYAVDLGNKAAADVIKAAAIECDPKRNPGIKVESSHVHVSISVCPTDTGLREKSD